jgi:hypothetical protein
MRALRRFCFWFGLVHGGVLTLFMFGPELSPLMVLLVDAPIASFTCTFESNAVRWGIPIVTCSVLYPAVIYLVGSLVIRRFSPFQPRPQQDK